MGERMNRQTKRCMERIFSMMDDVVDKYNININHSDLGRLQKCIKIEYPSKIIPNDEKRYLINVDWGLNSFQMQGFLDQCRNRRFGTNGEVVDELNYLYDEVCRLRKELNEEKKRNEKEI